MSEPPVVCVDGPSGSGKGTLSKLLAESLDWHLLDSGAIYRLVGLAAVDAGLDLTDPDRLARLAAEMQIEFDFRRSQVLLNQRDVSARLRTEEVAAAASRVASLPAVREALLAVQRGLRRPPGLVADGRDMGTVVFPDAPVKIFLTASAEERAERRYKQLKDKGIDVSLRTLLGEIEARDRRDRDRAVAPLKPAANALIIDSTGQTIDAVFATALDAVRACLGDRSA